MQFEFDKEQILFVQIYISDVSGLSDAGEDNTVLNTYLCSPSTVLEF